MSRTRVCKWTRYQLAWVPRARLRGAVVVPPRTVEPHPGVHQEPIICPGDFAPGLVVDAPALGHGFLLPLARRLAGLLVRIEQEEEDCHYDDSGCHFGLHFCPPSLAGRCVASPLPRKRCRFVKGLYYFPGSGRGGFPCLSSSWLTALREYIRTAMS